MPRIYISEAKKHRTQEPSPKTENSTLKTVKIAGWVYDFRDLGKLKFVLVRDRTGILQVTAKKGAISDSLLESIKCNREDVVTFEGELVPNKIAPNGVELIPSSFELLNKVERKLQLIQAMQCLQS